jgi:hypothetical protein
MIRENLHKQLDVLNAIISEMGYKKAAQKLPVSKPRVLCALTRICVSTSVSIFIVS